jgi:hypothetical protein
MYDACNILCSRGLLTTQLILAPRTVASALKSRCVQLFDEGRVIIL